jgi:hypothetical protein
MATDWSLILSGVAAIGSVASLVRVSTLHSSTDRLTASLRSLYKDFSSFRTSYKAAEDARALWASRVEGELATALRSASKVDATATEMYNKLDAAITDIRELTVAQQKVTEQAQETLRLARLAWESSQIATEVADKVAGSITDLVTERRQQR